MPRVASTESSSEYKLEARNVCKDFLKGKQQRVQVLNDISFQLRSGEFAALVGASGSGKTTLLRILDGLVEPTSGEVRLNGKTVDGPGPDRGFVFQMDSLWPWRTGLENVSFGLEVQRKPRRESTEAAKRYIQLVGLEGFERHYPYELSRGMRQRVNLARALALEPEVLLMDEPFASLDAQTREVMQVELLRIWAAHRRTVVFVTHQIDEAVYLADRVFVLTARPGSLKAVVDVGFPRPRSLGQKRTPEFMSLVGDIWQMIEQEVLDGLGMRSLEL